MFVFYQEVEDGPLQRLMKKARFSVSLGQSSSVVPFFAQYRSVRSAWPSAGIRYLSRIQPRFAADEAIQKILPLVFLCMYIDASKVNPYVLRDSRGFGALGAILGANVDGPPYEQPEYRFGVVSKLMGPLEFHAFTLHRYMLDDYEHLKEIYDTSPRCSISFDFSWLLPSAPHTGVI
jgi:hypothetical protein